MRYYIGKVKLEHKIIPRTEKGEAARDQLAAKSLSYINTRKNGFLGCVTSVYNKTQSENERVYPPHGVAPTVRGRGTNSQKRKHRNFAARVEKSSLMCYNIK